MIPAPSSLRSAPLNVAVVAIFALLPLLSARACPAFAAELTVQSGSLGVWAASCPGLPSPPPGEAEPIPCTPN